MQRRFLPRERAATSAVARCPDIACMLKLDEMATAHIPQRRLPVRADSTICNLALATQCAVSTSFGAINASGEITSASDDGDNRAGDTFR